MTITDDDQLAADYVLGTLDADARSAVVVRLLTDADLAASVADWEYRLAPLDASGPALAPPSGLWGRIAAAVDATDVAPGDTRTVRENEGDWEELFPGAHRKRLFVDTVAGSESFLLRLDPGAVVPHHGHSSVEECMVLEGSIEIDGEDLSAGDYHIVGPGAVHHAITSTAGALLFLRGELRHAAV